MDEYTESVLGADSLELDPFASDILLPSLPDRWHPCTHMHLFEIFRERDVKKRVGFLDPEDTNAMLDPLFLLF